MAQMILTTQQKQITARLVVLGRAGREWDGRAVQDLGCKLLYLEWMGNGALLNSTGNWV